MASTLKRAALLTLPPLLLAAGACPLFALPKGGASEERGTDIRNSEVNIDVDVSEINAARGTTVNVGSVDSGKSGTISNMKINTEIGVDTINAGKSGLEVGNVTLNKGASPPVGHGITSRRDKTDKIGNVNVEGSRVKEVTTVVGGSFTEKIKERNKSNTLADNDGVDARGVKHVYVGRDDIKEAEQGKKHGDGPIDLGNTTVSGGGKVKKVKTFVEAAGKALGGGRASRHNSSSDSGNED